MEHKSLLKPAVFVLILVTFAVLFCEFYIRNKGVAISYDDGPSLWSNTRKMVYEPADKACVFIGSSRNKFDLDIPTWEKATGIHAIQLAIVGSCPRSILTDLANDSNFKGKLIVDVTEGLFFSNAPNNFDVPNKNIKYFHDETPAQKASFQLNKILESMFVFLDKDFFSLNAQLDALEIPSRPGVFMMPIFPRDFDRNTFERQSYMTNKFVVDTLQQNQVKGIWFFFAQMSKKAPPMKETELTSIFESVKNDVDKIKSRGGEVLFVRTPSSGPYLAGENMGFPRAKYWDRLLNVTECQGIHFVDYPAINHFECPEFSHLSQPQAIVFTQQIIKILETEKGWKFPISKN